jgi:septal ring factor EnvC (AmiA/AmiB activator)
MHRKRSGDSPLHSQQEELAKQERALRQQMEELENLIAQAPKLAEERLERERQERMARASAHRSPLDSADVLEDARYESAVPIERPPRPRRAQRRAARLRLLTLVAAVIFAGTIVLYLVIQLMNHL